jgi:hypothetical protein
MKHNISVLAILLFGVIVVSCGKKEEAANTANVMAAKSSLNIRQIKRPGDTASGIQVTGAGTTNFSVRIIDTTSSTTYSAWDSSYGRSVANGQNYGGVRTQTYSYTQIPSDGLYWYPYNGNGINWQKYDTVYIWPDNVVIFSSKQRPNANITVMITEGGSTH